MKEAEDWFRHALTVVAFVENKSERERLELEATSDLARFLLETDHYEEAGRLIQRWRELATDSEAVIRVLASAVHFQARRGGVEQAKKEMKVVPADPPVLESRNPDLAASPPPQASARSALLLCTCTRITRLRSTEKTLFAIAGSYPEHHGFWLGVFPGLESRGCAGGT